MPQDRSDWCTQSALLNDTSNTEWSQLFANGPERIEVWRFFAQLVPPAPLTNAIAPPGLPFRTLQDWVDGMIDERHHESAIQLLDALQSPGFIPSDSTLSALFTAILNPEAGVVERMAALQCLDNVLAVHRRPAIFQHALRVLTGETSGYQLWPFIGQVLKGNVPKHTNNPSMVLEPQMPQAVQVGLLRLLVTIYRWDMLLNKDSGLQTCQLLETFTSTFVGSAVTHLQPAVEALFDGFSQEDLPGETNTVLHEFFHLLVVAAWIHRLGLEALVNETYRCLHRCPLSAQLRFVRSLISDNFAVLLLDTVIQNFCAAVEGFGPDDRSPQRRKTAATARVSGGPSKRSGGRLDLVYVFDHYVPAITTMVSRPVTRQHAVVPETLAHAVVMLVQLVEAYVRTRCVMFPDGRPPQLGLRPEEVPLLDNCNDRMRDLQAALETGQELALFHVQSLHFCLERHYLSFYSPQKK
ncbi:hypothetical protein IWQ60_007898 [Tieghemiomyces parasiticus]|uniref:Uncharacterized protein n=1 Tax=Tieghemiomyces parasiticus TaxID=78921 RepID=A0A9W7ZUU9_9FUNG|nr:hypothetical protein IWQ60_007898 [Tieghemiomyces parasiticus]